MIVTIFDWNQVKLRFHLNSLSFIPAKLAAKQVFLILWNVWKKI